MNTSFKVGPAGVPDGKLVDFGPPRPDGGTVLSIPTTFSRTVTYPTLGLSAEIECAFTGDRIEVESIRIRKNSQFVTTVALTQLSLPLVIRAIAEDVIPNSKIWAKLRGDLDNKNSSPEFLAQIYWFEHVSWGSPRASIMTYMNWSRTNANFHITKFSRNFPMPGVHANNKSRLGN